ncbi:AMSH-like ubiquitin thioesterase 1 isoform X2 [Cryptomeria japonica]|uniref:AMSH-like ubiquitin thioesterase 1 isoform X2 n=1 Tax=Cryptomeria japonica TaxID=3369 RepID=UPI0025AC3602|nr:AMSH-like ubiquitin thioesterase 1 isoform X2 [Cryptomeria japonica]
MKNALDLAYTSQKVVAVDNRIPIRYYYRIASNLINQARVYREENNIVDLYTILIRFSSLVSETIPQHQDYPTYAAKEKRLQEIVDELEALKPTVQRQVGELNKRDASQNNSQGYDNEYNISANDKCGSWELPNPKSQVYPRYHNEKDCGSTGNICMPQNAWGDDNKSWRLSSNQMEVQMNKLYIHVPKPREETLSRHSFLRSSCHQGKWEPSDSDKWVEYPCNFDLSLREIPRFDQLGGSTLSPGNYGNVNFGVNLAQESGSHSLSAVHSSGANTYVHAVRQFPSPVLSIVQSFPPGHNPDAHVSSFTVVDPRVGSVESVQDDLSQSTSPQHVHISPEMMEVFLELAKSNTEKDLETCGILAGSLKQRTFYVTTLIIPKQESTSNSCYTMNEEEIYAVQDERSLFPLGWIHTHPTQTCFMSSVDLHTQYSYQIMLPEAIAIVMSPTDSSRKYGIFRLSDPGGITILKQCQQRGFHLHEGPADGSPLYDHCSNVLINPKLKFDVVDIR